MSRADHGLKLLGGGLNSSSSHVLYFFDVPMSHAGERLTLWAQCATASNDNQGHVLELVSVDGTTSEETVACAPPNDGSTGGIRSTWVKLAPELLLERSRHSLLISVARQVLSEESEGGLVLDFIALQRAAIGGPCFPILMP